MDYLASQLGASLQIGATYALLAVGYAIAYSTMNLVNFAHGEVFMVGAVVGYVTLGTMGSAVADPGLTLLLIATLAAAAVGAGLAYVIQRALYRPIVSRGRLSLVLVALGTSLFLQQAMLLVLRTFGSGSSERRMPLGALEQWSWHGLSIGEAGGALLLAASIPLLLFVINRTDFGLCMRAVAHDLAAASRAGIRHQHVTGKAFALGGALAGAAGVFYASQYTLSPFMGVTPGLKAFLACVLGGRTVMGSVVGGLLIGVVEGLVSGWLGAGMRDVIAGALLILILAAWPSGLVAETRERTI